MVTRVWRDVCQPLSVAIQEGIQAPLQGIRCQCKWFYDTILFFVNLNAGSGVHHLRLIKDPAPSWSWMNTSSFAFSFLQVSEVFKIWVYQLQTCSQNHYFLSLRQTKVYPPVLRHFLKDWEGWKALTQVNSPTAVLSNLRLPDVIDHQKTN